MNKADALAALAGLAQESRLDIFRLLVEQGPEGLAAGLIAERLGMANATLSFHLKELANAGLVGRRQDGRFVHYAANFATAAALVNFLMENCCRGAGCAAGSSSGSRRRKTA